MGLVLLSTHMISSIPYYITSIFLCIWIDHIVPTWPKCVCWGSIAFIRVLVFGKMTMLMLSIINVAPLSISKAKMTLWNFRHSTRRRVWSSGADLAHPCPRGPDSSARHVASPCPWGHSSSLSVALGAGLASWSSGVLWFYWKNWLQDAWFHMTIHT